MPNPGTHESVIAERYALYADLVAQGMRPYLVMTPRTAPSATVEAAKKLGISLKAMQRTLVDAAKRGYDLPEALRPNPGFVVRSHNVQVDAQGKITRQSIQTGPQAGDVFQPLPGHLIKGESALLNADGEVVAKWVKTREGGEALQALTDALLEVFGAVTPRPTIDAPSYANADLLTLYPIADLHLGMMAWGKESGNDYDLGIASKLAVDTATDLVARAWPSETAVILGMGDYFHQNDQKNATPRSGHQLDVDGRWPKVLLTGVQVLDAITQAALAKHERVIVRMLPGNHDPDAAIALTIAIAMAYRDNPRVTVDLDPSLHWYYRHGKVLLGATHGHTMRADRMAMMLATDRAADWGETLHKHFFFGHIHHDTAKDVGPVRVESFRTIAAKDAYASGGGYRSPRTMSSVTFCRIRGEIGRHKVSII